MGISPVTLPVVVERTRDVKEAVRVKAYEMLGFGAKPEDLRVQGSNLHIQGVWRGAGVALVPCCAVESKTRECFVDVLFSFCWVF
jgi:hypothetical protein